MRPLSNFAARDVEALLHPTTNLAAHRTPGPLVLERGEGVHVYDTRRQALHRGPGRAVVHGARLRQRRAGRGRARADGAAVLLAPVRRPQPRAGDRAGREDQGDGARARPPRCSSPTRARRPTTPRSSLPGTTTTRAAGRRRRRSSARNAPTTAPPSPPPACRACPCSTPTSTCRWRACCTPTARTTGKYAEAGESEEDYATRLAAQPGGPDRARRARDHRRLHRRAGDGRGRRAHAARAPTSRRCRPCSPRHDIAFIADEVICGFGRTGNWWGSQTYGIRPDTVHHGQGDHLGLRAAGRADGAGGDVPGAAWRRAASTACSRTASPTPAIRWPARWRSRRSRSTSASTSSAHVQRVAPIFQLRLKALADHPLVGEARGVGLIGALELMRDKRTQAELRAQARRRRQGGALCRGGGPDLPRGGGDSVGAVPAADHRRRRDQRHVRRAGDARSTGRRLGAQG